MPWHDNPDRNSPNLCNQTPARLDGASHAFRIGDCELCGMSKMKMSNKVFLAIVGAIFGFVFVLLIIEHARYCEQHGIEHCWRGPLSP